MNTRSLLYTLAQLFGDASALKNKSVFKRMARRSLGRATGKQMMRRLIKRN